MQYFITIYLMKSHFDKEEEEKEEVKQKQKWI